MENKKRRIPTVSPGRLEKTRPNNHHGTSREERKQHAFIKGREPQVVFSFRVKEADHKKLELLKFGTRRSINQLLSQAVTQYLESDEVKSQLRRVNRMLSS